MSEKRCRNYRGGMLSGSYPYVGLDTVGKNTAAIKEYIQKQLKDDLEYDQMTLVEYIDPFTGEPGMWCSWQIFSAPSWRK